MGKFKFPPSFLQEFADVYYSELWTGFISAQNERGFLSQTVINISKNLSILSVDGGDKNYHPM